MSGRCLYGSYRSLVHPAPLPENEIMTREELLKLLLTMLLSRKPQTTPLAQAAHDLALVNKAIDEMAKVSKERMEQILNLIERDMMTEAMAMHAAHIPGPKN